MPAYVVLFKFTDQGIRDIKNIPDGIKGSIQAIEAAGGKILSLYSTIDEYDFVVIGEAPSDEVALTTVLGIGS